MGTKKKIRILLILLLVLTPFFKVDAINLWVGESYTWDFGGMVMGSTYNMNVSSNGGYLSITGSGFYRKITPTQYFSGTATVTAEWDYTLYYGDTKKHQKVSVTISCNENPVSIFPTSVTLSPGETYQLSYKHSYDNQYVGAANAYFSGGNSSFSVTSGGLITAKSPGSGYVNVYSKVSNAANAPYCQVTVKEVEPTGASIGDISLLADQSKDLSVTVSPSNATVKSKQWHVKNGSDVVSFSGQRINGLKPGTATIYCTVNGSIRSNDATVTVTEPKLVSSASTPTDGATDISVFTTPLVTYSHSLSEGDAFNAVTLKSNGTPVSGTAEISGNTVSFLPHSPLNAHTEYALSIPANAVKNKWGSPAKNDVLITFTTGALEKATVSMNPVGGSYLTRGDKVVLSSFPSDAIIYYTVDGSEPNLKSPVYLEPIYYDNDFTIKAFAVREGYESSEVVTGQYYKSQSEIIGYYPNDANTLFNYSMAVPHIRLSGSVTKSNNFRRISLTDGEGNTIPGEAFLTDYLISFVPEQPLENAKTYTLDIPRDAVKTLNGEVFKGFKWSFKTPTLVTGIAMQGDNSVYTLSENGVLKMRGMEYVSPNPPDGSFSFKDHESLFSILTGVDDIACGYTHRLVKKGNSLIGSGMVFCGETGDASSVASIGGVKTFKAGFQTSAIIGEDNSLWMCGRNDFLQLGDNTGTSSKAFIKVADNVLDVALGNGYTLFVDSDNILWGVGRNHRGQLGDSSIQDRKQPVKVMEGVAKAYASTSGFFSACITTGNQLYTWGDNASGQLGRKEADYSAIPAPVLDNVTSASLGEAHILAVADDCKLYSWGSNAYGQIAEAAGNVEKPIVMEDNVKMAVAGPNTSLILSNSGAVTGWGHKDHQNFGSGEGNACHFMVEEGIACNPIKSVSVSPSRFEIQPDCRFALVAVPNPVCADYESVEWVSDNPEIAAVEGNGIIHTGNLGEATVTVRFTDRFGVSKEAEAKIVCTANPDNSGVSEIYGESNGWTLHTEGNMLIVENATIGQTYTLFNLQGMAIDKKDADNERVTFQVNQPGIYLVKSGTKTVKAIVR